MPSFVAEALRADGWYLRSKIPWIKKNPMPESTKDRPTNATEYFFLFSKRPRYFWDAVAVRTAEKSVTKKMPDGWDTGPGAHGKVHRDGREKGKIGKAFRTGAAYVDQSGPQDNSKLSDKQRGHGRRHAGFNDRWDAMSKEEQQAGGANMRNYLFEATVPFKGPHFATFPPKVIEPFILAGTSEKGCCPECGAPWVREIERRDTGKRDGGGVPRRAPESADSKKNTLGVIQEVTATGWQPSCECDAGEPKPCVILDCFGGAGTTGLVADRHNRDAVLIEISAEYAEIARQRIVDDAGMLADVQVVKTGDDT